jgi:hypothetical protein
LDFVIFDTLSHYNSSLWSTFCRGKVSELYVASTGVLQRFNLKTMVLEKSFALPIDSMWGQTYVQEMHVVPGTPKSIVVELFAKVDPAEDGAALYNDSGLVNWIPGQSVVNGANSVFWPDSFTFTSASNIYAIGQYGESFFYTLQNNAFGLTLTGGGNPTASSPMVSGHIVRSDGTLLYTNSGQVWDPTSQKLLGTYLTSNGSPLFYAAGIIPEPSTGHTYALNWAAQYADYGSVNIDVYSQSSFGLLGSVPFVGLYASDVADLMRWGANGFALRSVDTTGSQPSANQIVISTSSLITNSSVAAPVPAIASVSPTQVHSGDAAFTLQVNGSGFTNESSVVVNSTPLTTTYSNNSSLSAQVPASDLYTWGQLNVQVSTPAPGGGVSNYEYVSILPGIALSTSLLDFGNLTVGASSTTQTASLINETTSALAITSIVASGDFAATNNCGSSLAANSSCTISVVLKPSTPGMITGTLTVSDSAPSATQTTSLLGFGLAPYTVGAATGGSLSATVSSGGTATYNLQLNPRTGFSGNVNLSCSGAPQYATCSVSTSSMTLTSGGTVTFTVSVSTETTTTAATATRSRFQLAGFGLLTLPLILLLRSRRRAMYLWLTCTLLSLAFLSFGIAGCGRGSNGSSGTTTHTYATAPGTYTLTITASSSSVNSMQTLKLVVN